MGETLQRQMLMFTESFINTKLRKLGTGARNLFLTFSLHLQSHTLLTVHIVDKAGYILLVFMRRT